MQEPTLTIFESFVDFSVTMHISVSFDGQTIGPQIQFPVTKRDSLKFLIHILRFHHRHRPLSSCDTIPSLRIFQIEQKHKYNKKYLRNISNDCLRYTHLQ